MLQIKLKDNFNDNSIDTAKWDETDPGARITEANEQIELYCPHDTNYDYFGNNYLTSDDSVISGIAVAQAHLDFTDPQAQGNNAIGFFGVYVDSNNFAGIITRAGAPGDNVGLQIKQGGSYVYSNPTVIKKDNIFKVTYDIETGDIEFFYWNGSSWTQMGTTQNYDLGSTVKFAITAADNTTYTGGDQINVDNAFLTKGDYDTQTPYCTWDLLNELWASLTSWVDDDSNAAVSSISPAGQLYLDCRALSLDGGRAARYQDIGTIGTGDYSVYMRFKGDVWDGKQLDDGSDGIRIVVGGGTNALYFMIANQADGSNDGVWIYDGASWVRVITKTWDNNWHTIKLDVHNSQTDVDIYIDGEETPSATDADCSYQPGVANGFIYIYGWGTIAGNGEYHLGALRINTGVCPLRSVKGPTPMLLTDVQV
jgi:hypothetical protein